MFLHANLSDNVSDKNLDTENFSYNDTGCSDNRPQLHSFGPQKGILVQEIIGYCDNWLQRHFCQSPPVSMKPKFSVPKISSLTGSTAGPPPLTTLLPLSSLLLSAAALGMAARETPTPAARPDTAPGSPPLASACEDCKRGGGTQCHLAR